jgi:hypothetical protein
MYKLIVEVNKKLDLGLPVVCISLASCSSNILILKKIIQIIIKWLF